MDTLSWLLSLALLIWAATIYNLLVRDKNRVLAAWSDISVQLKRRHDLIPKLVEAVRAYAGYEQSLLEEITRLRGDSEQVDAPPEKGRIEASLSQRMRALLAVAEAYPELKADGHYLQLLEQLSEVENHIQFARRYYNGSVRNLNVRIDSFPDLLIARPFRFRAADFFELESATEAQPPEIHP
jgi:LemA protein